VPVGLAQLVNTDILTRFLTVKRYETAHGDFDLRGITQQFTICILKLSKWKSSSGRPDVAVIPLTEIPASHVTEPVADLIHDYLLGMQKHPTAFLPPTLNSYEIHVTYL